MTPRPDVFSIHGFLRFYLVLQVLFPLFLVGITLWAISNPGIELTEAGPLILLGLLGWAGWEVTKLCKWFAFRVEVSEDGIAARGQRWTWDQIQSARAKTAIKFDTFIELTASDGASLAIPAAIQNEGILLALIEKHVPSLVREG